MNDSSDSAATQFAIGFIFGLLLGFCITFYHWRQDDKGLETRWQQEAVKHGAAHWVVQPDGSTKWEWKNP